MSKLQQKPASEQLSEAKKDLQFFFTQLQIIEHAQDHDEIKRISKKWGLKREW